MQHTIAGLQANRLTVLTVSKYPLSGMNDNWDFLT